MKKLQTAQNKLARVLENVYLKDRMSTKTLLSNQVMLSVNQVAAQIKLTEIWKANNVEKFQIKVIRYTKDSSPNPPQKYHQGSTITLDV